MYESTTAVLACEGELLSCSLSSYIKCDYNSRQSEESSAILMVIHFEQSLCSFVVTVNMYQEMPLNNVFTEHSEIFILSLNCELCILCNESHPIKTWSESFARFHFHSTNLTKLDL